MSIPDCSGTKVLTALPGSPVAEGERGVSNALYHTRVFAPAFLPKAPPTRFPFLLPPTEPGELGWLANYRVLRTLGVGGMGYVFHALDMTWNRHVALKVMKPDLDDTGHPELRFRQEARIMATIQHEHLVTVYHVGEDNGVSYLAMELLHGETLDRWLHRVKRADAAEVLRIGREIATGLDVIHRNGLMHRDLKPGNLWLEAPSGRVKILDFGLARYVDSDIRLTQSDHTVGTPGFLAPEQARGEAVDLRGDLFSLGAVLYCMCTGAAPFQGSNTLAVLTALAQAEPQPPHEINPRIPQPLSRYVLRLLAKNPGDRPASAEDVIESLARFERGDFVSTIQPNVIATVTEQPVCRPWFRRRLTWVCAAGLLGAIIAVAVAWLTLFPPRRMAAMPSMLQAAAVVSLSDSKVNVRSQRALLAT